MKLFAKDLNENIHLFLNDIDDYSDDAHYNLMCEATLNKFTQLLTESSDIYGMLLEAAKNEANGQVFKDFLDYFKKKVHKKGFFECKNSNYLTMSMSF